MDINCTSKCWAHSTGNVDLKKIACLKRYRGFKFQLELRFVTSFTATESDVKAFHFRAFFPRYRYGQLYRI